MNVQGKQNVITQLEHRKLEIEMYLSQANTDLARGKEELDNVKRDWKDYKAMKNK